MPSGTHEAVIRKLGFAKASEIVASFGGVVANHTLKVVLDQATVLGTVHIVGKMEDGLSKIGFLARKQQGRGWYLTPEQIAEKNPSMTTDLMRMARGLDVLTEGGGRYLVSNSSAGSSTDGCINIFIDHSRFDQFQPGDVDDAIPTGDLGAIEYYSHPSDVPTEFTVIGKTCATLVVWTKTMCLTYAQVALTWLARPVCMQCEQRGGEEQHRPPAWCATTPARSERPPAVWRSRERDLQQGGREHEP